MCKSSFELFSASSFATFSLSGYSIAILAQSLLVVATVRRSFYF